MSIDAIPPELAGLNQFCLREGKRPFIRDVSKGGFTPGWTDPAGWMVLAEALEELERNKSRGFDGIGYLNAKAPDSSRQITGGDLDASRDPITGWVSLWAREFLEQTRPFYCEVSPSGCGLRFFYLARLPNRANSLTGSGPQDMPDEAKEHIIAANPKVKEKIDKGQPAFNGLELYEDKRHLTITGNTLKEFCYSIEDRTGALADALELAGIVAREKPKPALSAAEIEQIRQTMKRQGRTDEQIGAFLEARGINPAGDEGGQGAGARPGSDEMPGWVGEMEQEANKNRLPHISILDVALKAGFVEYDRPGDQIRGSIPALPSTTGYNIVICEADNFYCYMHRGLNKGGDAWTWLACECGAVKWEEAGAGALKDPAVFDKTIKYAIEKGYIKAEDIPARQRTALQPVEWAEGLFVGLDGCAKIGKVNEKGERSTGKVSEGYAYLAAILEDYEQIPPERHYVIRGKSISSANEFEITAKISDFGDSRIAKKILLTLWAEDRLGKMDIDVIKSLSPKPVKHIRILNRPAWIGDELAAPGLAASDARFNYARKVCVDFSETGNPEAGRDALIKALLAFEPKNTALLFATVLGAPIVARCWPGDRYCLFIQGTTQAKKTSAVMVFMSMYGKKYSKESSLVRWGDGATGNAIEHIAAKTGPFPFPLDNYKQYTDKDPAALQKLIHAVVEGTEKDRLNRDSTLRAADEYQCSLIVTGEQFPGQDAATRARIIELLWSDAINLDYLTDAQAHIEDINAFGKAWLQWLNSEAGQAMMKEYAARFDEARLHYLKAASNPGNAGRLASNAAVVALTWEIFNQWTEGHELAERFYPIIKAAIDEHVLNASADISDQLDGEKFIAWLRAELLIGRYYLAGRDSPLMGMISEQIGHFRQADPNNQPVDEVLIDPAVLSAKLLPAWQRTTNGTKTDKKALLRQLVGLGYLQYDEGGKQYAVRRRIEGTRKRMHAFLKVLDDEAGLINKEGGTNAPVPQNRHQENGGTGGTGGTGPKDEMCKKAINSDEFITNLNDSSRIDKGKEHECNIDINTSPTSPTSPIYLTDSDLDGTGGGTGGTDGLPDNIRLKLKKIGRKDSTGRRGLAVSDLEPGDLEYLQSAGWTEGTIEASGIKVIWAPEG